MAALGVAPCLTDSPSACQSAGAQVLWDDLHALHGFVGAVCFDHRGLRLAEVGIVPERCASLVNIVKFWSGLPVSPGESGSDAAAESGSIQVGGLGAPRREADDHQLPRLPVLTFETSERTIVIHSLGGLTLVLFKSKTEPSAKTDIPGNTDAH
eukprot:GHVT01097200.1.p1 GENE.GHVT01097200.1~~GHVT01097200.1.p1  ORF type:complete len:154 (-),score=15.82 GHVT01097200.1:3106-3567(-)